MGRLKTLLVMVSLLMPAFAYPQTTAICEFGGESNCIITVKLPEPWFKGIDVANGDMDGYDYAIDIKGFADQKLHDMDIVMSTDGHAPPDGFCEVRYQCKRWYRDSYMLFPIGKPNK